MAAPKVPKGGLNSAGLGKPKSVKAGSNDGPNISNKRGKPLSNKSGGGRYQRDRKGRFD